MIRSFYLTGLMRSYFFAKAIALDKKKQLSPNLKVWAYYNLGMYETVTKFPTNDLKSKGLLAKIVSHAACGDFDKSKELINDFKNQKNHQKYILKLADALCPFIAKESLELISDKKPSTLYFAILLKLEEIQKAKEGLYKLIQEKEYRKKPEILLYYSNSKKDIDKNERIKYLNMYLNIFKIPKIKLTDKSKDLNVMNISCNNKETYSRGPLVTILMTSYNIGERINTAIQSILNQSYQNIELLIVDDASSDNSVELINSWEEKDDRVKLISLKTNVGTYVAKNIGLLKSKGEFITCHDSDDWSHPIKIERQVLPLIQNKRLIATISSWVRIDDFGNYYARPVHPLIRINPSSLMFRKKEVLQKAGLWDCVRTGADSEYIARLKIVFGRLNIKRIKEPLAFGAHRDDSLMTSKDTGYCNIGMSPQRLEYWESWSKWHIEELAQGKKPNLEINLLAKRKFDAPQRIITPSQDIQSNLIDNNL